MIAYIYRRKRKVEGRLELQRTYRGRFRVQGDDMRDVSLDTPDKQVAQSRLRELIQEREREVAGLTAPASERQAVAKATLVHLTDFLADLKVLGRANEYTRHVKSRVEKLVEDCGFRRLGDISPDKFVAWRGQQTSLSPKTNNEYLNSLNAFLNWLVTQNRLAANPLLKVAKVDVRGRQKKRRALTPAELPRLMAVTTPERRLIYLTAIYTGLRLGELQQLVSADLQLDAMRPFLTARASTTKNRKEAVIPLHPSLAQELRGAKGELTEEAARVFKLSKNISRSFGQDLQRAGITALDALGRKLDFHALRKTFATRLAGSGVPQRLTQELMRHQDANLTALTYTDASLLPTFDAVASLKWEGDGGGSCTHIRTQSLGPEGPDGARSGAGKAVVEVAGTPENKGQSHALAGPVPNGQMAERGGFESVRNLQKPQ